MDRLPRINANFPGPVPGPHRRVHRLHDADRRHGAMRYEPYARDLVRRPAQGHPQYYQWHWETMNRRWIWLRPHRDDRTYARCIVCGIDLAAYVTNIRRHENSRRHLHNMEEINVPVDDHHDHHLTEEEFQNEKAAIKILITAYFASEGQPYIKIDTLLPLIKRICRYPGVIQEVKLNRWSLSKLMKDVIAPVFKQELAVTLSQTKFSISFDESTSVSRDKHQCLLVRFADNRSYSIQTVVWDLIQIYRAEEVENDETARTLYNQINDSLFSQNIADAEERVALPPANLLASASDGCNTMIGLANSVRQRLIANYPGIVHVVCPCHGAHLCAMHAIEEYPEIPQLLTNIYNWFCSAKRLNALKQNQIDLNIDTHKLLRFVSTRWLTMLPALIRMDEQMIAIDRTLANTPANEQAQQLLILLRTPVIRCFTTFLIFILEVVEDANGWMQTEGAILPEMFARITSDFKDILCCYMNAEHVEASNLLQFDTENEQHFLPDDDMLIGNDARNFSQALNDDEYAACMRLIRTYLIRLATEWLERMVLPWSQYRCLEALFVENAFSADYHLQHPDIIPELAVRFPRAEPAGIDAQLLQDQWDDLIENEALQDQIPDIAATPYVWFIVRNYVDENEVFIYREIADFALNILSTPHSNASAERVWSVEKYIHNKYRNLLQLQSIRSNLHVKECLKLHGCGKEVHRFEPPEEMIRRVRHGHFEDDDVDDGENDPFVGDENQVLQDQSGGEEEFEDEPGREEENF